MRELDEALDFRDGSGVAFIAIDERSLTKRRVTAVFNHGLGEIDPLSADSDRAIRRQEWGLFVSPLLLVFGAIGMWLLPAGPVHPIAALAFGIGLVATMILFARRSRFEHRSRNWRWFQVRRGCPACRAVLDTAQGYAIGSEKIWLWIGPEKCAQCGSRWPLLP